MTRLWIIPKQYLGFLRFLRWFWRKFVNRGHGWIRVQKVTFRFAFYYIWSTGYLLVAARASGILKNYDLLFQFMLTWAVILIVLMWFCKKMREKNA